MHTESAEIADGIHRLSTFVEAAGICFNQYLVVAEEPLLFHSGMAQLFPSVSKAVERVLPVEKLHWVSYGHFEADECGALNRWLDASQHATAAVGRIGTDVSLNSYALRAPRALADGEVLDLGGKRARWIDTPHVPHGWDAGVIFEETTGTLLCGDLFTRLGRTPAITSEDVVGPALEAEGMYMATALTPNTAPTLQRLAALRPRTLALMHGPAFQGDGARALEDLAFGYEERLQQALRSRR